MVATSSRHKRIRSERIECSSTSRVETATRVHDEGAGKTAKRRYRCRHEKWWEQCAREEPVITIGLDGETLAECEADEMQEEESYIDRCRWEVSWIQI